LMSAPEHVADKFSSEVAVLGVQDWIIESHTLAREKAYTFNGKLLNGGTSKQSAELLPDGYFAAVEPVAKRRGVLAGYRMAAVLKEALGN